MSKYRGRDELRINWRRGLRAATNEGRDRKWIRVHTPAMSGPAGSLNFEEI